MSGARVARKDEDSDSERSRVAYVGTAYIGTGGRAASASDSAVSTPIDTRPGWMPPWLHRGGAIAIRVIAIAIVAYFAFELLAFFQLVVLPGILALVISAALSPIVRFGDRHRTPRSLSALASILVLLIGFGALVTPIGFAVADRADKLVESVTEGFHTLTSASGELPIRVGGASLSETIGRLGTEVKSTGDVLLSKLAGGAMSFVRGLTGAALTILFVFFFLKDGSRLLERAIERVRQEWLARGLVAARDSFTTMTKYVGGLAILASFNSAMTAIALTAIDVPLVLPIVCLTFAGSFVPFLGPVVSTTAGSLVALAHGGFTDALLVIGAGLVIQALEGNVLEPVVMGRVMRLHALAVLAAVSGGAILGGLAGAFLAVPLLAWLIAASQDYRRLGAAPEGVNDAA